MTPFPESATPERPAFASIQLVFFILGITTILAYLTITILNGLIYYHTTHDIRPLLTSTLGRVIAPDYHLYLNIATLQTRTITKETADALKLDWFITLLIFLTIHIALAYLFLIKLPNAETITRIMGIGLFLVSILLFACFELIYVYLISNHIIIPYTGIIKSATHFKEVFYIAGTTSTETTILTSTNLTLLT